MKSSQAPLIYKDLQAEWNAAMGEVCSKFGRVRDLPSAKLLEKLSGFNFRKTNRYIISGISGSGKTTLGRLLEYQSFKKLPTAVVRPPRPEEIQGLDYIFLDENTFNYWRRRKTFLFSHTTNGVSHGFLKQHLSILKGQDGKFYLDKSIKSVFKLFPYIEDRCTLIYLLPPSFDELYFRIKNRENSSGQAALGDKEIMDRFEEEIKEFRQSALLSYVYYVNDNINSLFRLLSRL